MAGISKVNDENGRIRIPDPDPLVRGMELNLENKHVRSKANTPYNKEVTKFLCSGSIEAHENKDEQRII